MVTIGFSFDHLDLVVHTFQLSSVNGIITVIEDAVTVSFKGVGELLDRRMFGATGQSAPLFNGFCCPGSGLV